MVHFVQYDKESVILKCEALKILQQDIEMVAGDTLAEIQIFSMRFFASLRFVQNDNRCAFNSITRDTFFKGVEVNHEVLL